MNWKLWKNRVKSDYLYILFWGRSIFWLAEFQQGNSEHEIILRFGGLIGWRFIDEESDGNIFKFDDHIEKHLLDKLPKKVEGTILADFSWLLHLFYDNILLLFFHGIFKILGKLFVWFEIEDKSLCC